MSGQIVTKKILFTGILLPLFLLLLPLLTFAAIGDPIVPENCLGGNPTACNFCDLLVLGNNIYVWILGISTLLATGLITFAGIQMIINSANPGKASKSKDLIIQTLFALAIVFGSYLIVSQVIKALSGATKTDFFTFSCTGSAGNVGTIKTPDSIQLSGKQTIDKNRVAEGNAGSVPTNATEGAKKILQTAREFNGKIVTHQNGKIAAHCTDAVEAIAGRNGMSIWGTRYTSGTPSPGDYLEMTNSPADVGKYGPKHGTLFDHADANGTWYVWSYTSGVPMKLITYTRSDREIKGERLIFYQRPVPKR